MLFLPRLWLESVQMIVLGNYACFAVDDPSLIMEVLPEARLANHQGKQIVAVPHTLEVMQLMRSFGLNAPAPTESYPFPGKYKPYSHQRAVMQFLVENPRVYNLSGLGTGKTLAALWAADYLMRLGAVRKCLITAPLSCLERVWGDSLYQTLTNRKFVILHGPRQQRLDLLKTDWDFAVVNHHGVGIVGDDLPKEIDLIIIDELATLRNAKGRVLWGATKKIIKPHHRVWGLTGSPTPNAPTDAWAQSKLLTPETYNGSFTRFKMDTMLQLGQFKWIPRANAEKLVNQIMQPSIRFALEDCIDLPETIYQDREAEMSTEQKQHYEKLRKECVTEIQGMQVTAVNAAVLMGKLVQAAVGCLYSEGETLEIDFGPRLAVLEEIIDEADGKIIIFVPLTGILNVLARKLARHGVATVDGSTAAGRRNQIFSQFNSSTGPRILLANPGCMSHGLNLHHQCHTVVWFAPITSNDTYFQANARTVRPGQKFSTNIIHISASPVERKIYNVLKEKGRFQDSVLEMLK